MRLNINLATQPYQDLRRFLFRWGFVVATVTIVTIALLWLAVTDTISWRRMTNQANKYREGIAKCDRETQKANATLNLPENRTTRDRSKFINGLIARKAFSWTEVLTDLERILPSGISITAIQPTINDNGQLEIRLAAAGPSRDRAVELVSRMESSPHFRGAMIRSDAVQQVQDQNHPQLTYHFEITALYVPPYERPATSDSKPPETKSMVAKKEGQ